MTTIKLTLVIGRYTSASLCPSLYQWFFRTRRNTKSISSNMAATDSVHYECLLRVSLDNLYLLKCSNMIFSLPPETSRLSIFFLTKAQVLIDEQCYISVLTTKKHLKSYGIRRNQKQPRGVFNGVDKYWSMPKTS